ERDRIVRNRRERDVELHLLQRVLALERLPERVVRRQCPLDSGLCLDDLRIGHARKQHCDDCRRDDEQCAIARLTMFVSCVHVFLLRVSLHAVASVASRSARKGRISMTTPGASSASGSSPGYTFATRVYSTMRA